MASNYTYRFPSTSPPSSLDCFLDSIPLLDRETDSPPPLIGVRRSHCGDSCDSRNPSRRILTPKQSSWSQEDFASDLDRRLSMNVSITFRANEFGLEDQSSETDRLFNPQSPSQSKTRVPNYSCFPTAPYDPRGTLIESYRSYNTTYFSDPTPKFIYAASQNCGKEPILKTSQRNYAFPNLPALSNRAANQPYAIPLRPATPVHFAIPSSSSERSYSPAFSSNSSPSCSKTPSPSPSSTLTMSSSSSTLAPTISASSSRRLSSDLLPRRKFSYSISPPLPSELYPSLYDNTDSNETITPFLDPRGPPPTPSLEPYRLRDEPREDEAFLPPRVISRSTTPAPRTLRKVSRPKFQPSPAPPPSPVVTPTLTTPDEVSFMDFSSDNEDERGLKKIKSLARLRAGSRGAVSIQDSLNLAGSEMAQSQRQSQEQSVASVGSQKDVKRAPKSPRDVTLPRKISTTQSPRRKTGFPKVWRMLCCTSRDA